jgi:uncharacterized protein (TIGR02996 family)
MVDDPEAALLAAVHANPDDEQARTVYARDIDGRGSRARELLPRGRYGAYGARSV